MPRAAPISTRYVVTDDLRRNFDEALTMVGHAVTTGRLIGLDLSVLPPYRHVLIDAPPDVVERILRSAGFMPASGGGYAGDEVAFEAWGRERYGVFSNAVLLECWYLAEVHRLMREIRSVDRAQRRRLFGIAWELPVERSGADGLCSRPCGVVGAVP